MHHVRLVTVPVVFAFAVASGAGLSASPIAGPHGIAPPRQPAAPPPALNIPGPRPTKKGTGKIKHVVIILQENRSFDDLFQSYPGADTQPYGFDSNGNKITLQPVPLEASYDINHDITTWLTAYDNGKMDGFNLEPNGCGKDCTDPQYGYVPQSETTTYFAMAKQYVLADRMFTSQIDDSFISHQYIISGQANDTAYFPSSAWGCDGGAQDTIPTLEQNRQFGPSIQVCWDVTTLGDELDAVHKPWRFYASQQNLDGGIWSAYQAIHHIFYGKDWAKDVLYPQKRILTDVGDGKLAAVTWVTPTCATSDHSSCGSNEGPAWVASIVNAIGKSDFWKSTAIFVMWDEWGGWYDHVVPPQVDFDGLGFRVPLLIISPYAKQGYVTHVQYEHGSLLRFAEDQFGLAQMAASDARANDPATDAFDFTQKPRPFVPFKAKYSARHFLDEPIDLRVPDAD
jgi:phospholipase C